MKITVYTITDCTFSQAEKQYLQSKQLQFDEKNLESNREYLTEMLNISNNFAGTPVTKIEKDDGQIIVLKGFTQDEFDKALAVDPNAVAKPVEPQEKPAEVPPPAMSAPEPVKPPAPMTPPSTMPPQVPVSAPPQPMSQPSQPVPAPMNRPPINEAPPTTVQAQDPFQPTQPSTMNTAPQQPQEEPQNDQALNSVLQNLQSRSGDNAQ